MKNGASHSEIILNQEKFDKETVITAMREALANPALLNTAAREALKNEIHLMRIKNFEETRREIQQMLAKDGNNQH